MTEEAVGVGDTILSAKNITKEYPGTRALDNVSFDIEKGKVNVLIGENGAGKSTLMKIIAGIETPTAGSIILDGKEAMALPSSIRNSACFRI